MLRSIGRRVNLNLFYNVTLLTDTLKKKIEKIVLTSRQALQIKIIKASRGGLLQILTVWVLLGIVNIITEESSLF